MGGGANFAGKGIGILIIAVVDLVTIVYTTLRISNVTESDLSGAVRNKVDLVLKPTQLKAIGKLDQLIRCNH